MLRTLAATAAIAALVAGAQGAAAQTAPATPAPAAPAAAPTPPPILPFDQALANAANTLFSKAQLPEAPPKLDLVIDPLIDGATGAQSVTTRSMERTLVNLVKSQHPRFEVQPFNTSTVAKSPIVLIGTFTLINNAGQPTGPKDAYRICLALADLKSGKIIAKGAARAKPDGIDATPTAFFSEAPVFAKDPVTEGYIKSCQASTLGGPIDQVYADRIVSAALVSDAIEAYNAKKYQASLELYQSALKTPGGDQLRVHNGIYLANWKLGKRQQAADAFGKVVDYGLANNRLGVRFLFRPGSTQFVSDKRLSGPYDIWLKQIADKAAAKSSCLEVVGHTSPTGPAALNQRLSVLRAEYVKDRLEAESKALASRMIAAGAGSKETLVGSGKDNASDALDRRVEFKIVNCQA